MALATQLGASFRDPSGFVFVHEGVPYRQINGPARDDYDHLMRSGLYGALTERGLLIPHEEVPPPRPASEDAYLTIRPSKVAFISYPYEWCFGAFRDAALATLAIQRLALRYGMTLKDASAFNIQFHWGRPLLIDTLSLQRYQEGAPWVAYRQFCQHFVAPLALMAYRDVRLSRLLLAHLDGVPLDLARSLLPMKTRLNPGLLVHLHLHASTQKRFEGKRVRAPRWHVTRAALEMLVAGLENLIRRLRWEPDGSGWSDYCPLDSYSTEAFAQKTEVVGEFLRKLQPGSVWDLGANTGSFSRLAGSAGAFTLALDSDAGAVEKHYRECVAARETRVLPLVMDLVNPSAAVGWDGRERMSLQERGPADLGLALALVHHLALANNVPLSMIAEFMRSLFSWLAIEFVPKEDPQAQRLLACREDVFPSYCRSGFEEAFGRQFAIETAVPLCGSARILYLMRRRD